VTEEQRDEQIIQAWNDHRPYLVDLAFRMLGDIGAADYEAVDPEVVGKAEAAPVVRSAFNQVERAMFRMLGIKQFLLLRLATT
jgi:hypothetical protein